MIIVTGGAGFIGSNLVHELNAQGADSILVVDNLSDAANPCKKFLNLTGARFADFMDKAEFRRAVANGAFAKGEIRAILHQGACSDTLEDDGRYMMDNNFAYSKELLHFALRQGIPFVYASTAALYGQSEKFKEEPANEHPLNVYGFSKLTFDNYVRNHLASFASTVVGLRYFNVFGPREMHKGRMASVIHHFTRQLKDTGTIRMFEGSGGYGNGEQRRDFVFVRDLAKINFFFAFGPVRKAIVNAGTGKSRSFNDVAAALMQVHGPGKVEYIPFPADLGGRYQHFTEAEVTGLRAAGYLAPFTELEAGVKETFAG